ncbi:hypothetical protein DUE52_07720 [Larkinella punicea]|uniref:Uncharacterized protein n=2 Tax=Larkinella punicea TaxID=2315727 RepID=A0A368JUG7_9BACT|nr:hypothetical protein DUE52_07720 [Larkinella punicea]
MVRINTGSQALSPATLVGLDGALRQSRMHSRQKTNQRGRWEETASIQPQLTAITSAERDSAASLFRYLDSRNGYVEELTMQDLTVLPVGLKKQIGNRTVELGILKVKFFSQHAELTVFARIKASMPDPYSGVNERELFFGADQVHFTRDGGLTGDFKLVLLGDYIVPMGNMTLRLRGGLNRFTGATEDLTYATFNCGGLVGLGVAGDVLFPRSMLVPIEPVTGGVIGSGQVMGTFQVSAPDFSDLIAKVDITPFAVTGYEQFGFQLTQAVLDLSDKRNDNAVLFPPDYFNDPQNSLPDGSDPGTWKGVYIQQFRIILPPEFKARGGGTERISIEATNLLYDRQGLTALVAVNNPLNGEPLSASGWAMTLDRFELAFEKHKLVGGAFQGQLTLPIAPTTPVGYRGEITKNANYGLEVFAVESLKFPLWRATATLQPSSRIELKVVNGTFKPRATLHGSLGIYAMKNGTEATEGAATLQFKGITFENLVLQTDLPRLTIGALGYQNDQKLAGFSITVSELRVAAAPADSGDATLYLQVRVNLMKETFGATAGVTAYGKFVENNGIHEWNNNGITLSDFCIKGTVSNLTLAGCVSLFENDAVYGKGFRGSVSLGVSKLAQDGSSNKMKFTAEALFGAKDDYRYWYAMGGTTFNPTILLAGPLEMNAIYAGAYHHMRPRVLGAFGSALSYEPTESIQLGFKAVMGLVAAKKAFTGQAGVEIIFNQNWGLNSVGLFGEGVFTGTVSVNIPGANKLKTMVLNTGKVLAGDVFTQEMLEKKAKQEFGATEGNALGSIQGRVALLMDFEHHTFHGDAEVFVNAGGLLRGTGANNRAGWMVMHFDENEWYCHLGHPDRSRRIGLLMHLGPQIRIDGYLMIGHRIPGMPPPPTEVLQELRYDPALQTDRPASAEADAVLGKGFVFGASLSLDWRIRLWIPYLNLTARAGFDMLLKEFNAPFCGGRTTIGSNNWYGRGQIYAFLQGEAGVYIFGKRPLITVSAAALLEAGLPNPAWLDGRLALGLKLGRKFNQTVRFNLEMGSQCRQ